MERVGANLAKFVTTCVAGTAGGDGSTTFDCASRSRVLPGETRTAPVPHSLQSDGLKVLTAGSPVEARMVANDTTSDESERVRN